ncbi:tRNA lysidine(34) synthetase TilS [Thermodesulfobacterium hydrogeniphilum]|uniref:tRNA lysidine(34) synthetase TilS n=1 Tax=Thermodesulfobacterium hydrogeniphilum TaxID=161156 RepID=UPI000571D069|nr:tRNA lysidine(34) synthetase TilS [Thermodesulfobacterium hydrogeniphilum]
MFINTIKKYIEKFNLFQKGDRVLLGISGGLDSVVLLEVLYLLKKDYELKLFVSHYDHKIRKDSLEDASFVYKLCKEKNIPFFYTAASVPAYAKREKLSLEMAGRELRYNLWFNLAKKYDFQKIALAHHLDDLAEEIFMKLIRGTGKRGLAGIPIKREELIVRPFLFVTKEEIRKFALEKNLNWREDYTNKDLRFLRNKIRHILIPFLEKHFNKNIKKNIKKTALIIAEEEELIEEFAKKKFEEIKFYIDRDLSLKLHELKQIPSVLRRRIYFIVFQKVGIPIFRITYKHLESLENLVIKRVKGPVYLPGGFLAYRGPGYITFTQKVFSFPYFAIKIETEGEYSLPTKQKLKIFKIKNQEKLNLPNSMIFSAEKLTFPFVIRKRKPGDRIFWPPIGHKKLKKFLWEKEIPSYLRENVLVIEHINKIIGVWNLYIHPEYKVKKDTKEVIVLQII